MPNDYIQAGQAVPRNKFNDITVGTTAPPDAVTEEGDTWVDISSRPYITKVRQNDEWVEKTPSIEAVWYFA